MDGSDSDTLPHDCENGLPLSEGGLVGTCDADLEGFSREEIREARASVLQELRKEFSSDVEIPDRCVVRYLNGQPPEHRPATPDLGQRMLDRGRVKVFDDGIVTRESGSAWRIRIEAWADARSHLTYRVQSSPPLATGSRGLVPHPFMYVAWDDVEELYPQAYGDSIVCGVLTPPLHPPSLSEVTDTVPDSDLVRNVLRHLSLSDENLRAVSGTTGSMAYRARLLRILELLSE